MVPSDSKKANASYITHLGWSFDSQFVLAACARKGVVQVYKLEDETWSARIDAGVEGILLCLPPKVIVIGVRTGEGRMGPRWTVYFVFFGMGSK